MKTIELKHIKDETDGTDFNYQKMLIAIATAPMGARGTISLAEMEIGLPLLQKLETSAIGEDLGLTDSEHQFLTARVAAWPWPAMHPVYLAFGQAVRDAKESAVA